MEDRNPRAALAQVFATFFSSDELRRFLLYGPNGAVVAGLLPGPMTAARTLAAEAVDVLERHSLIDEDLFRRLESERPRRSAEIQDVRALWPRQNRRPPITGSVSGRTWDVFIAHATADRPAAEQLYDSLVNRGASVFLASRCLLPGDTWDTAIAVAQRSSRMTAILLSSRVERAWYAREEIAAAIAMAREEGSSRRVVPIYLEDQPATGTGPFYGLGRVQALSIREDGGHPGVADRLMDVVRLYSAPAPAAPPVFRKTGWADHPTVNALLCALFPSDADAGRLHAALLAKGLSVPPMATDAAVRWMPVLATLEIGNPAGSGAVLPIAWALAPNGASWDAFRA